MSRHGSLSPRGRVLHFIDSGGMYGAERVILNLSRESKTKGPLEPVVGAIVPRHETPVELVDRAAEAGVQTLKIKIRNAYAPIDIARTASRLVSHHGIDLIHCHGYKPSCYGYALSRITGVPVMATCHLWYLDRSSPMRMRLMIRLERRLYRHFAHVVAVSAAIRDVLLQCHVAPSRLSVVPNGIPLGDYSRPNPEQALRIRRELDIPESHAIVTNAARLTHQKAQDVLIEAAARLAAEGLPFTLLIVGDGELRQRHARAIERAGLGKQIRLLGFRKDINDILGISDVFALPSRDEGMPMSLLEAVACRTPAVVTAVGNIGELIKHGENGIVVSKDNVDELQAALRTLLVDRERASRYAEKAYAELERHYSSEAMHAAYAEIYSTLPIKA